MTLLSVLGIAVLVGLLFWQFSLKFKKSWMFRSGAKLYFLLPAQTIIGRQLPLLTSLIGSLAIGLVMQQKGLEVLTNSVIAIAIWMLNVVSFVALYARTAILQPDGVSFPFRFSKSFDRIKGVELQENTIQFKLTNKNWILTLPTLTQKRELHTVLAFIESLKMTANLQDVPVSESHSF